MNPIVCCRDLQIRQEVHKLGVLILLWRRQLGMTQYQLADKSGLAQSYISDLESGAIDPRWSTIYRVVNGLGQLSVIDDNDFHSLHIAHLFIRLEFNESYISSLE